MPREQVALGLDDGRRLSGATEFTLIGANGHIIASSSRDPTSIVPHRPSDAILVQLRQSGTYIGLDPIGDAGLHVRVVVSLPEDVSTAEPRILQALYPVAERTSTLADTVQSTYAKYRELTYLRKPLKTSFTLTLSLVLLLSLFAAVWAAFYSARRMVAPLRDLAHGTRAVADGDYETQLPTSGEDEVGFLVESFNDMTRRLARGAGRDPPQPAAGRGSAPLPRDRALTALHGGPHPRRERAAVYQQSCGEPDSRHRSAGGVRPDARGDEPSPSGPAAPRPGPRAPPCDRECPGRRRQRVASRRFSSSAPAEGRCSWRAAPHSRPPEDSSPVTSSCSTTSRISFRPSATPPGARSLGASPTRSRTR